MDPAEAIAAVETALRGLIEMISSEAHGHEWLAHLGLTEGVVERWEARRSEEAKRRDAATVPSSLLEYAHLYELREIVEKNWELFKPVFHDRKRFSVDLHRLEDFRNAPAHSRELLPHEIDLVSGIAGHIRNQATLYRSKAGPDRKHYPIIEMVIDSFGNRVTGGSSVDTQLRLSVGTTVEFHCRGWDPHDRELRWSLSFHGSGVYSPPNEASGSTARLRWHVNDEFVAEWIIARITLTSSGKYHRHGRYDATADFIYAVDPPTG